ncbi:MAG: (2Fe-2S) ferredoxin domain-containing protein [Leptolyngbyaceae cyanobacterium bins.349]|nr:(2Fe-2S) ferredoxin domain-containing protein [Leptolyngbyaceae cyanobacterium bins.349]
MSTLPYFQPMEFNFEGEFLGFADPTPKCKYIRLNVLSEELSIKVSKELRSLLHLTVQSGTRIQVSGIGKLDRQTHTLKLKAKQIVSIGCPHPTPHCPDRPSPTAPAKPCKPRIKVRVCQKSKCLKRGGKALCESMRAALQDWDLHDQVAIEPTGCLGRCSSAPNLVITPGKQIHSGICVKTLPKFERLLTNLVKP